MLLNAKLAGEVGDICCVSVRIDTAINGRIDEELDTIFYGCVDESLPLTLLRFYTCSVADGNLVKTVSK